MNIIKQTVALGILAVLLLGATYLKSPAFRAALKGHVNNYIGWTEEARQADPVGFVNHVESKLKEDIGKFNKIRRTLSGEVGELAKKEREQRALLTDAEAFATEFREAYQSGMFPVEVRNAAYTEKELRSQVGTILAEITAYKENIQRLSKVRQEAETKIEELIVCVDKTEAQLAAISTQRELLKMRELTTRGSQLLTQIDNLFNQNQAVISSNPVRSVRELQMSGSQSKTNTSRTKVSAFLSQKDTGKVSVTVTKPLPVKVEVVDESAPIFQQSTIGK